MWLHSTMLLFVDLDGLHVSAEIGFSVPGGPKPLVFGDKCLLCGNAVWLTDRAQSLISPLPPRRTWINHLHGKATAWCWNSCLELSFLFPHCAVRLTLKAHGYKYIKHRLLIPVSFSGVQFNVHFSAKICTCSGESYGSSALTTKWAKWCHFKST